MLLLWAAKLISFLISLFHLGQASNFPGKVVLYIKKDLLSYFKLKKDCKIILITGTNGKSTTCGMLASILKTTGKKVAYNTSGANLLSGIASTFCQYSDPAGNLTVDYVILEVDEATLPLLTEQLKADIIGITNFFRDQLDRFGELDTTVKLIEKGIGNNKNTTMILNADDVRVAFLKTENPKIYYGLAAQCSSGLSNDKSNSNSWLSDPQEITKCPDCNFDLVFTNKFLAHLGDYRCSKCNLKRPETNFLVSDFKIDALTTNFDLIFENQKNDFFLPMIGTFNLYNAACTIAISRTISNITQVQIQKGFQSYSTIFGRGEKITIKTPRRGISTAWIYLIKNPTGTTEVLKTLSKIPNARFLIAINDDFADGRDISWLWDARFDILTDHKKEIYVSGKRALDMALRLRYSGIQVEQIQANENISTAIKNATQSLSQGETLYILPTYTVLLEMQRKRLCKGQPL